MIWFTSDTHFGHANIIKYSSRPFRDTTEMDRELIATINRVVSPGDTLYHLGDWCMGVPDKLTAAAEYRERINCRDVRLILGNHDIDRPAFRKLFASVRDLDELVVGSQTLVMCHYPMVEWNRMSRGAYHVFGHCHNTRPFDPRYRRMDVGVDAVGYAPITLDAVVDRLTTSARTDV